MIKKLSEEDFALVRKRVNTNVVADIQEFIQSGDSACEIVTDGYKNIHSAYGAYMSAAKRCGYGVSVMTRGKPALHV